VRPEGPFTESDVSLLADREFVIDPDVFRADGSDWLAFATDFEDDAPIGTGIARVRINVDLSAVHGDVEVVARASREWHVFDPARSMPWKKITGVEWERGDAVCWYCVEAPAGGIVSPTGRAVMLYSGGNYEGFYAVAALVQSDNGTWTDSSAVDHFVLAPDVEAGFFGPGHCSVMHQNDETVVAFHARYGSVHAPRQFSLASLHWNPQGFPECVPLGQ